MFTCLVLTYPNSTASPTSQQEPQLCISGTLASRHTTRQCIPSRTRAHKVLMSHAAVETSIAGMPTSVARPWLGLVSCVHPSYPNQAADPTAQPPHHHRPGCLPPVAWQYMGAHCHHWDGAFAAMGGHPLGPMPQNVTLLWDGYRWVANLKTAAAGATSPFAAATPAIHQLSMEAARAVHVPM